MSAEYNDRIEDRESWLASMPDDSEAGATRPHLLATAALLHGIMKGVEVPEGAEEHSRQKALATWEERFRAPRPTATRSTGWPQTLSGLLRVVFTLGRRK